MMGFWSSALSLVFHAYAILLLWKQVMQHNTNRSTVLKIFAVIISAAIFLGATWTALGWISSIRNAPDAQDADSQSEMSAEDFQSRSSDEYIKDDANMMSSQIRTYIARHQNSDRSRPHLYEINLNTKSTLLVGLDEEPAIGLLTYNTTLNCSGDQDNYSFSVSAYLSDGSLYCID